MSVTEHYGVQATSNFKLEYSSRHLFQSEGKWEELGRRNEPYQHCPLRSQS
jgi:hypothetical protein